MMAESMNVLIYEHLCAGGVFEGGGASALLDEGAAMLKAALSDFGAVTEGRGWHVFGIADQSLAERFTDFSEIKQVVGDTGANFKNALIGCDGALLIAPETGGVLQKLTESLVSMGKINLGSGQSAVAMTGDKPAFASLMERVGIPHPSTFIIADGFNPGAVFGKKWVSKPVDGAGSEGVSIHPVGDNFRFVAGAGMLAQEYTEGEAMSLCVVSGEKESMILSVNRQMFDIGPGPGPGLRYAGGVITSAEPCVELIKIVDKIKLAIPGLRGFWGLDYIQTGSGPVVIEVNPRLTSSYCALVEALNVNPAGIILDSALDKALPDSFDRKEIEFTQNSARTCEKY
ncbi:FIG00858196: hypothetical protein [hydrothermal vent metagenome]|uniref:ATP-grasp domain-containing protein n=1 Tax=hydrothermal vent metagenome TaxID=652676 RepID=A0A3B1BYT9_9ZZZZ